MSDTDDLLDELEQLENASAEMQEEVEKASEKNKALEASGEADHLDAAALSLEAAKTLSWPPNKASPRPKPPLKFPTNKKRKSSNYRIRMSLGDNHCARRRMT